MNRRPSLGALATLELPLPAPPNGVFGSAPRLFRAAGAKGHLLRAPASLRQPEDASATRCKSGVPEALLGRGGGAAMVRGRQQRAPVREWLSANAFRYRLLLYLGLFLFAQPLVSFFICSAVTLPEMRGHPRDSPPRSSLYTGDNLVENSAVNTLWFVPARFIDSPRTVPVSESAGSMRFGSAVSFPFPLLAVTQVTPIPGLY